MTPTNRLVLDLGDIQALRIECANCQTAISWQLDQTINLPDTCPNCNAEWMRTSGTQGAWTAVDGLIKAVKAALRQERDANRGFRLRLEFPAPPNR